MKLFIIWKTSFGAAFRSGKADINQTVVVGKMVFGLDFRSHFRLHLYGIRKDNIQDITMGIKYYKGNYIASPDIA
jgi:hypothetical protein